MKFIIILFSLVLSVSCTKKEDKTNSESKESLESVATFPEGLNKECPVSGEEIDPSDYKVASFEGKDYAVCCNKCKRKFEKEPAKYIAKLEKLNEIESKLSEKEAEKK